MSTAIRVPRHELDIREAVLQRLVLAHLNAIPGVKVWRFNVGAAIDRTGRKIEFGVEGQADVGGLMLLPSGVGQRLEIECKKFKGGRQTVEQKAWQIEIERYGGLYVLARSLSDAVVPVCVAMQLPYVIE